MSDDNDPVDSLIKLIDERIAQHEPPVYEIEVGKKYILAFKHRLTSQETERMAAQLEAFLDGPAIFMVIDGQEGIKLIKVESNE